MQDLMLLAVVERLTAHTVPFNNQYCSHYSPAQEMGAVHRQAQTLPWPAQHGPGSLPLWRGRALHHTSPRMNSCIALQAQHNGQICTTLCSAKSQNRGLNPAFLDAQELKVCAKSVKNQIKIQCLVFFRGSLSHKIFGNILDIFHFLIDQD